MKGGKRYDATLVGGGRARRVIPMWPQSIRSNFVVPALQGLFLGVMAGVFVANLFSIAMQAIWPDMPWADAFLTPFVIFMSIFSAAGFVWRMGWIDKLGVATEDIRRAPGEPEPEPMAMPALPEPHAPILINGYAGQQRAEAEQRTEEQERLAAFIRGCEFDTSARYWQPREPHYVEFRNLLIGGGWAVWNDKNNKKAGWKLTPGVDVEDIIEAMNRDNSPTPTDA
jgi:hypothetical protein